MISFLTRAKAIEIWPEVGPILQAAIVRDPFGIKVEDIKAGVEDDSTLLAVAHERETVVMVSAWTIIERDEGKYFAVIALTGVRVKAWLESLKDVAEAVAIEAGCVGIMFQGRPGWVRMLKSYDYKHVASVMRKVL